MHINAAGQPDLNQKKSGFFQPAEQHKIIQNFEIEHLLQH